MRQPALDALCFVLLKHLTNMENKIKKACMSLPESSALRLFCSNELEFYRQYFNQFTSHVIREKRILEFENPNRVKMTYEFDVVKLEQTTVPLFVFLPSTRKNWMKVYWEGKRVPICSADQIIPSVYDKVEDDLKKLQGILQFTETPLEYWGKNVWPKHSLACFVDGSFANQSIDAGQLIVEFYDSFEHFERVGHKCNLFVERRYSYDYSIDYGSSHWIYVKAPDKFQVVMASKDTRAEVIRGNDPEIQAFKIHSGRIQEPIHFTIDVRVPRTLKWWYGMIVILGILFIPAFVCISWILIKKGAQLTPAFAQVGISIVAAIIASRGWMMNDETVLKRVSLTMTAVAFIILACLIILYSVSAFVVS